MIDWEGSMRILPVESLAGGGVVLFVCSYFVFLGLFLV